MTDRLPFLSQIFNAIEVNGSFYRQIRPETYQRWSSQVPGDFRFAVKGHRYVTHFKRLAGAEDPIRRLRAQADGLGDKLAVVLWQLPATFAVDLARLDDFIRALRCWRTTRHALELRHRSWFCAEVRERLAAARIAACVSDAPDFPRWDVVTTDIVYVRLHGHTRKYASSYSRESLRSWADRARALADEGRDVHVYFDNDKDGAAVRNAIDLGVELGVARRPPPPVRSRASRPARARSAAS